MSSPFFTNITVYFSPAWASRSSAISNSVGSSKSSWTVCVHVYMFSECESVFVWVCLCVSGVSVFVCEWCESKQEMVFSHIKGHYRSKEDVISTHMTSTYLSEHGWALLSWQSSTWVGLLKVWSTPPNRTHLVAQSLHTQAAAGRLVCLMVWSDNRLPVNTYQVERKSAKQCKSHVTTPLINYHTTQHWTHMFIYGLTETLCRPIDHTPIHVYSVLPSSLCIFILMPRMVSNGLTHRSYTVPVRASIVRSIVSFIPSAIYQPALTNTITDRVETMVCVNHC